MAGPNNTQFAVAVHVLIYLTAADRGRPVSSDELAESVNVSPVHVRRVLGPLREAGLLTSRAGAAGGWELAREPERIRLDEVWQLVHPGQTVASHGPNPECRVGRQIQTVLVDLEADLDDAIRRRLHGCTVADVMTRTDLGAAQQSVRR